MNYISIIYILIMFLQINLYALNGDIRGGFGIRGLGEYGNTTPASSLSHDWGWYQRTMCNCQSGDDGYACCNATCHFEYCQAKNGIGTIAGTAPSCIHLQQQKMSSCSTIVYDTPNQEADGVNSGETIVNITALRDSLNVAAKVVTEIPVIMYEIKVKQGIFLDTGSNILSFTLDDYIGKGRKFKYKTYNCNDETIKDKEFETFTLSEISTLGKDGLETKIQLQTIKVPFGCKGPYYTIRTVVEKTETKEPPMRTGGRTVDLDTITLKDTKQVVYIDPLKGEIKNVPFIKETSVKKTTEKYKLNTSSCQYEVVKKVEELPYHKSSFAYLNNLSSSLAFTKDTVLDLQISGIREKKIKVPWHELKERGNFSDNSHWTKKKSKIEKESEVKKIFKLNAKGQNKLPLLKDVSNFGIAVEQALGQDAKDTGCRIQREFYDVLENGANIIHPTVSYRYKVNIYQSSKNDIEKAKNIIERMENYSGSYTEEKQLYDGLNNPLYAPKSFEKEKSSQSEKEPSGILDTLLDRDDEESEVSMDDLQMFTK